MDLLSKIIKDRDLAFLHVQPIPSVGRDDYDAMRSIAVQKAGEYFCTCLYAGCKAVRLKVLKTFADIAKHEFALYCPHQRRFVDRLDDTSTEKASD